MEFSCDYCKVVFTDIEQYLRHKYIIHDGRELRRLNCDNGLTWNYFFKKFEKWSGTELSIRSKRSQLNEKKSVETFVEVYKRSFGEINNDPIPIRQQVLPEEAISATIFEHFESHKNTHSSEQQVNPLSNRNQVSVVSRCSQIHFRNPQIRPDTCERSCKVSDHTTPSIDILSSHLRTIDKARQTIIVNRETQNLFKNFENSNEYYRAEMSSQSLCLLKTDEGSSSTNQAEYLYFRKDIASESPPLSHFVESKKKKIKYKSSRKIYNEKPTVNIQDQDEEKPSGYQNDETKLKKPKRSTQRSGTHSGEKTYVLAEWSCCQYDNRHVFCLHMGLNPNVPKLRCDYCNGVLIDIEHYLKHKYITHYGQRLCPLTSDDRLSWQSFLERFAAWSRRELVNRSTRGQVKANERVDTPAEDDNLYFGEVHFDQIPIRQQVLTQGGTSSSVYDHFERHNYNQLSGQQMYQQFYTNQLPWAPNCKPMESCNLQMRPGTSTSEIFSGIPHLNRPALAGFTSHFLNTQNPIQPSIVNRSTHQCKTSYENSVAIYREPMSTGEGHAESPFAKEAQYYDVRKRHASKSPQENYLEDSMKKRLNRKGSLQSLNKQSALCEDYNKNMLSGCQVSQTELRMKQFCSYSVLTKEAISSFFFKHFERHKNIQPLEQQVNPPVNQNQIYVVSRCSQIYSLSLQLRPDTCETCFEVSDHTNPSIKSLLHISKRYISQGKPAL
ncbi:hypothetical protein NPIL_192911 [Nephila pilipes]|uniref:C2H2-type domain-containing protein n=1 Tax=Nephila pilipes TaxID=299642 RepID=A0A8X6QBS3_NEPPI|nr:hypothetical protein NPIL_192911 [Nephila pilipes]